MPSPIIVENDTGSLTIASPGPQGPPGPEGEQGPSGTDANKVDPPLTSTSPGTAGQYADDTDYHYRCIAANTWRRFPHSDWTT